MRFVNTADGGLIWPSESLTGGASPDGTLLDTEWHLHWPGDGHVYLNDRDLVDIAVPALEREAVQDALKANGWTSPGETAAKVAELEAELESARNELTDAKVAQVGFEQALEKLEKHKAPAKKPAAAAAKTKE